MNETIVVKTLEQLKPYLNKNGVLEIITRDKNKRYKTFYNIALQNNSGNLAKQQMENAISILSQNNSILTQNNKILQASAAMLQNVAALSTVNIIMSGLNLCATCVGFKIMSEKLNKISMQINQVMQKVDQLNEIHTTYEFNKVVALHSDMLDCRKKQKKYSEEQMRELVDAEYTVLLLLVDGFNKNLVDDEEATIFTIFSLASMLAVSLRYFDETYYYNNNDSITGDDKWHLSHDKWMSAFDTLLSKEFVERLQDHAILSLNLPTPIADAYYLSLCEQISDAKETIIDNQELIISLENEAMFALLKEQINQQINSEIYHAFEASDGAMKNKETVDFIEKSIKQISFA